MKAEKGTLTQKSVYIGQIENTESVELICRVSGTVEEVNVSVGDHVSKNSVLAHFDDTSAEIELEDTKTAVESAKKGYESAQKGLETAKVNYDSTVTRGVYDLNTAHELSDYQKEMDLKSMESDIAYLGDKIGEFTNTTLQGAKDDVKNYKKKKKRAKDDGDEEAYEKYKELLEAAEKTLENAEQSLHDLEHSYNSKIQDYQAAAGVRERTNGASYAEQQAEVMSSVTLAQRKILPDGHDVYSV